MFARCDKEGKPTDEMWSTQYATNLFQDLLTFMNYKGENHQRRTLLFRWN